MSDTYDGGVRWGVVRLEDTEPRVIPMDDEKMARKFHASWTEFARKTAFPNNPEIWPRLVSAQVTWQEAAPTKEKKK